MGTWVYLFVPRVKSKTDISSIPVQGERDVVLLSFYELGHIYCSLGSTLDQAKSSLNLLWLRRVSTRRQ